TRRRVAAETPVQISGARTLLPAGPHGRRRCMPWRATVRKSAPKRAGSRFVRACATTKPREPSPTPGERKPSLAHGDAPAAEGQSSAWHPAARTSKECSIRTERTFEPILLAGPRDAAGRTGYRLRHASGWTPETDGGAGGPPPP